MGPREYVLLAVVIVVPLVIAVAVTLWSLKQVRYRPKERRPRPAASVDQSGPDAAAPTSSASADPTSG